MRRTLCLIVCLFVLSVYWMQAAENLWTVTGYVRNDAGQLLPHVSVQEVKSKQVLLTDSLGYFQYELSSDTALLRFSYVGYETVERLMVRSGGKLAKRYDVVMHETSEELEDVEVHGARQSATMYERLQVDVLKYLPDVSGGSIESLLKTFQGVSSNNELSSQYSVRGGSYDENSVYVNGVEVYRPYLVRTGEQEGLSFVNSDLVGSVNFSAGGFDARYGDKLSSVLEIEYRKPAAFEAGVTASLMGASAYVGQSSSKFSQMHGIRYKNASYLLGSLQTQAEYDPNFVDYQTNLVYHPNDRLELSFLGNFSQNTYNFVPETRSTTFGPLNMLQNFKVYFSGQEKDMFRTIFGALGLKYRIVPALSMRLMASGYYTDERVNYDIAGEYWLSSVLSTDGSEQQITGVGNYFEHARNNMHGITIKASAEFDWKLTTDNHLLFGFDWKRERVFESESEWEMRDSSGYSIPYQKAVNLYYSLKAYNQMDEDRFQAYLQDEYRMETPKGSTMLFTAGLRLSYWTFNRELTLSPRAQISWLPKWKTDMRFRLATGLYYQSPSFKEIKDTVTVLGNLTNYLNRNIRSQRSFQVILGMDWYYKFLRRPFKFSVDAYYKNLQDIITYNLDNVSVRYTGKNNAHGYVAGFDMKLFGEFVKGVDSWLSFSLMRAMEDVDNDGYGYIPRPTDQLFNVSLFFQDYVPGLPQYRVYLLLNFAQGWPVGPPRGQRYESASMRMPTYRRVDIGCTRVFEKGKDPWMGRGFFKPFQKIAISLECLNLFGFKNVNSYYWVTDIYSQQYAVPNYLTGRQFNLKLELKFGK